MAAQANANASSATVLGMGNPLLDISVDCGQELLEKYGLSMNNAIMAEEKHMPLYKEILGMKPIQVAGGATQNSIRTLQWMSEEEGLTAFSGCVGDDEFGKTLKACAEGDGVKTHYLVDAEVATGTCAVLVKDKERSLCANLSAANNYQQSHLEKTLWPVVEAAKFYYIGGFFLTVSSESIVAVGKHAAENNKVFAMNISAPFIPAAFWDGKLEAAFPYIDILFGNESEAEAIGAKLGITEASAPGNVGKAHGLVGAVALKLSMRAKENGARGRMVVITQGSSDTIIAHNGVITTYPTPKMDAAEIVDSNGAGDAFVGGFLSKYVKGEATAECVRAGCYAAQVILKTSGCSLSGKPEFK